MARLTTATRPRGIGITAMIFGLLGLACFWWVPFGQVLALAGLVIGLVGWVLASRRSVGMGISITATILCAAILAFDLFIAARGLEFIQFTALR